MQFVHDGTVESHVLTTLERLGMTEKGSERSKEFGFDIILARGYDVKSQYQLQGSGKASHTVTGTH
jgi:hypothetical protein